MKKVFLGLFMIFFIIFIIVYSNNNTFNDTAAMGSKIAKELDISQVSIYGIQEIDDYRIAGFTYDDNIGFAVFKQNEKGNYTYEYIKESDRMISRAKDIFYDYVGNNLVIVSYNENLNSIELKINYKNSDSDDEKITIDVTDHPSISVTMLPDKDFEGEFNFYDDKGNLIP